MKLDRLKEELAKHLKKYSYLLLVDDVWSELTWDQIKKSLPISERGSRIIVTTRFQAIASGCRRDKGDYVHKVGVLSADEPEILFMKVMFESRFNKEYELMQNIPSRIWEMCGGLPLAIVTMAGLVACNPHRSEEEWNKVCNALVPASVKSLTLDGVTRIISHCYNDMPLEIKTCLLYLCIFPKGRKISRKRLTRRWLAEGFVSEKQGLSVEDVAETYFNHLIRRKFIRAVEYSSNGKVKNYQVHDMVLEYIVSNASEENFIMVVGNDWIMAPPSNKVRRLSLQFQAGGSKGKQIMEILNLSHVRSLTLFGSLNQLPSSLKFGIVQVLDLEDCKDFKQHHAKEICKMLLLKYLSLRRTDIKELPTKIGNLQQLETLDIRETNVTELPKTVCQIECLVNILGGNKRTRKALKLPEDLKKKRTSGLYSSSSAYKVQFLGRTHFSAAALIWQTQIPAKVRFFAWTVTLERCLTADRLAIKGIPHNPVCQLCRASPETAIHIFMVCPFSNLFWTNFLSTINVRIQSPPHLSGCSIADWWYSEDQLCRSASHRNRLRAAVMLGWWMLWLERNQRIFHSKQRSMAGLCVLAREELLSWKSAGCAAVATF